MKYMMLIAGDESATDREGPEAQATYQRIVSWWEDRAASGQIVEGHQLEPSATATTVRVASNGSSSVTDGPFIEAKEALGGYAILDVADLDEAIALVSSWPAPGTLEIRPLVRSEAM